MIKIKLDELISYLEKERINSGEKNPFVYVGTEDFNYNKSIGNYYIESNDKDIYIISCVQSPSETEFNIPVKIIKANRIV